MDIISPNPYYKHGHNQIKICVSGAADTSHCGSDTLDIAKELGREIARQGAVLVTGATTGFPFWAVIPFAALTYLAMLFITKSIPKEYQVSIQTFWQKEPSIYVE